MRNGDDRTLVLLQMLLQPVDAFGVEVVGGLVQQQHVGLLQQQTAQCYATALASRQRLDVLVGRRAAQCVHGAFEHAVDLPAVYLIDLLVQLALTLDHACHGIVVHRLAQLHVDLFVLFEQSHGRGASLLDNLLDGLVGVELRLLFEISDRVARREYHFALKALVDAGDDLHQRRLTRAVKTDDADLGAVEERQIDIVEYLFIVVEHLAHADHGENYLFVCHIELFLSFFLFSAKIRISEGKCKFTCNLPNESIFGKAKVRISRAQKQTCLQSAERKYLRPSQRY